MKLRRWLLAGSATATVTAVLAVVAWRQEVGPRAAPRPDRRPPRTSTPAGLAAGTTRRDAAGVEQVWVPAGWFRQGSHPRRQWFDARADETPEHDTHLTRGFWIDEFEVTNERFAEFVAAGGYTRRAWWGDAGWSWKGERTAPDSPPREGFAASAQPRIWITWHEAEAYACWRGGRLPTEAEWEYAARGPDSRFYAWGDKWDARLANTSESGVHCTVPVGSFPAGRSWCGALDLTGNAWEWTADWFDRDWYAVAPVEDPPGPPAGTVRSSRGGSWGGPRDSARATRRTGRPPAQPSLAIGFRVVSDEIARAPVTGNTP